MIRQESTYNPDTYQLLEFKEFSHGELVMHYKYDEHNVPIYSFNNGNLREYIKCTNTDINHGDIVEFKTFTGDKLLFFVDSFIIHGKIMVRMLHRSNYCTMIDLISLTKKYEVIRHMDIPIIY